MDQISAFVKLNIKSLMIDKLSVIWSLLLPVILLIINRNSIINEAYMSYWWIYIILNSYIYGVGLHAMNVREYGTLKTLFSIQRKPICFFVANVITQIIYSITSILLFNFFAMFLLKFNYIVMLKYTLIYMFILLPVTFISYNITLVEKVYYSTVAMIVNIYMFIMLTFSNYEFISKVSPISFFSRLIYSSSKSIFVYIVCSVIVMGLSIRSIVKYSAVISWKR